MNISVRYYTRSGNTQKLAGAIADAVNATALSVDIPLSAKADILFLGCSYYAFDVDEAVKRFIQQNSQRIGLIVCFGTSAMMKSTHKPMQKAAEAAGVRLAAEECHCRGSFGPLHSDRPNQKDLDAAAAFAQKIVLTYAKEK